MTPKKITEVKKPDIITETTDYITRNTIENIVRNSVEKVIPLVQADVDKEIEVFMTSPEYKNKIKEAIEERIVDRCINNIGDGDYDDDLEDIFNNSENEKYTSFVGELFKEILKEEKVQKKIKNKLIKQYVEDLDSYCTLAGLLDQFLTKNDIELVVKEKPIKVKNERSKE